MRRRDFITLLGGAAIAWPLAARAQQRERMRRIGVLLSLAESDPEGKAQLSGFTHGLAELGGIEGRNLLTEVRWGRGDVDRIRTFAKELVALQPDVIVAHGTPVTAALQRETRTIPIVFVTVTDPVGGTGDRGALEDQIVLVHFTEPTCAASLDHLVGAAGERQRDGDAERLGGLEVQKQLNFRALLDRQLARLFAFENAGGVDAGQAV